MTTAEYIKRLREFLADSNGIHWSNEELITYLENAALSYSTDTELYHNQITMFADDCGNVDRPKDYISFIVAWNNKGNKIVSVPSGAFSELPYKQGDPEYIHEDIVDNNKLLLYPNLDKELLSFDFENYGVATTGYGVISIPQKYGTIKVLKELASCGDLFYIALKPYEEILDYMAIIFHALYQAYAVDSDFRNLKKSQLYYSQYKTRLTKCVHLTDNVSSYSFNCNFY